MPLRLAVCHKAASWHVHFLSRQSMRMTGLSTGSNATIAVLFEMVGKTIDPVDAPFANLSRALVSLISNAVMNMVSKQVTWRGLQMPDALPTKRASSAEDTSLRASVTRPAPAVRGSQVPRPDRPSSHRCVSAVCSATQSETSDPTAPSPPGKRQEGPSPNALECVC